MSQILDILHICIIVLFHDNINNIEQSLKRKEHNNRLHIIAITHKPARMMINTSTILQAIIQCIKWWAQTMSKTRLFDNLGSITAQARVVMRKNTSLITLHLNLRLKAKGWWAVISDQLRWARILDTTLILKSSLI